MDSPYTKILLKDVDVTVRVGLAQWERERPQRLIINIELYAEWADYLRTVTSTSIIDYCPIYKRIQGWRSRAHTDLVETFVSELLDACFECTEVIACKVSVVKTEVLDQAQAAGAEAFMTRRDYETSVGGRVIRAKHT